jgi:hypothetical protein
LFKTDPLSFLLLLQQSEDFSCFVGNLSPDGTPFSPRDPGDVFVILPLKPVDKSSSPTTHSHVSLQVTDDLLGETFKIRFPSTKGAKVHLLLVYAFFRVVSGDPLFLLPCKVVTDPHNVNPMTGVSPYPHHPFQNRLLST